MEPPNLVRPPLLTPSDQSACGPAFAFQALPLEGIEALLISKYLKLQSENECFKLVCGWVQGQGYMDEPAQQKAFKRLASKLRFEAMTPDFILAVVTVNHRIIEARLQAGAAMAGLKCEALRHVASTDLQTLKDSGVPLALIRAPEGKQTWYGTVQFKSTEKLGWTSNGTARRSESKAVGILGGYPWFLTLQDERDVSGYTHHAAFMSPVFRHRAALQLRTRAFDDLDSGRQVGFFVIARITLSGTGATWTSEPTWISRVNPMITWSKAFNGLDVVAVLAGKGGHLRNEQLDVAVDLTWARPSQQQQRPVIQKEAAPVAPSPSSTSPSSGSRGTSVHQAP